MSSNPEISNSFRQTINICRCCLSNHCYKDISSEYYFSGQKEVYEDMLRDTFDVHIKNYGHIHRQICEDCISRLRDAHSFKQLVVQSEEKLELYLHEIESNRTDESRLLDVLKPVKEDSEEFCYDENILDESNGDDEILANTEVNKKRVKKRVKRRLQVNENSAVPELIKQEYLDGFDMNEDEAKTDGSDDDEILANIKLGIDKKGKNGQVEKQKKNSKLKKDWLKIIEHRGKGPLLRGNSLKLILNSTICPFQWHKSQYRCFCCKQPFTDMSSLIEHSNSTHTIEDIEKQIIQQQNCLVKVEISNILCKICEEQIQDLNSLRTHLEDHNIKFELQEDLLIPFKIEADSLQCQICSQSFTSFKVLNIHVNRHFQRQVCHVCGAGFTSMKFLNLHKTRQHRIMQCKECDLKFKTKADKRNHDVAVHDLKRVKKFRFPCPLCSERFFQENLRVLHLVERHGKRQPEHKCDLCPKVFITKSIRNSHIKSVHFKERNQECNICHSFFYKKSDLERHKVTHTGEKKFSCSICNNPFASKDSLRRHFKINHVAV